MTSKKDGKKEKEKAPELNIPASPRALWFYRNRFLVLAATVVVAVALDQSSKLWAQSELAVAMPADDSGVVHWRPVAEKRIINGIFHFQYAENPAAAFSLTTSIPEKWRRPLLLSVGYLAMALMLGWMFRLKEPDVIVIIALSLILGGAIGNAIDRHWHAYVIDFISWRLNRFWPTLPPWPTFNIADASIVCGAGLIIFRSIFPYGHREAKAAALAQAAKSQ